MYVSTDEIIIFMVQHMEDETPNTVISCLQSHCYISLRFKLNSTLNYLIHPCYPCLLFSFFAASQRHRSGHLCTLQEHDLCFSFIFRDCIGCKRAIWFSCSFDSNRTARNSHPVQQTSNLHDFSFGFGENLYLKAEAKQKKSLSQKCICLMWNNYQSDLLTQSKFSKDNTNIHRK